MYYLSIWLDLLLVHMVCTLFFMRNSDFKGGLFNQYLEYSYFQLKEGIITKESGILFFL